MHVVMFADQHVASLGGAQVSMRLQRRFLETAGHTVTIVAPAMHGAAAARMVGEGDPAFVDMPSIPITPDAEYSFTWPGRRTDRWVDAALAGRPPVDVVHVQADFWGAFIGHRYARRHGLPVVHTMHNRVDVGIEATTPFPRLVLRALNAWQRRALGGFFEAKPGGRDGWSFLRRFASGSDAVTAPSSHFARRLEAHGVVPGHPTLLRASESARRALADGIAPASGGIDVIWNGIDDDVLDAALAAAPAERAPGRPRFVWLGRMSPEKRLLPFLEAVAESGVDADIEVIGGGGQLRAARRLVARHGMDGLAPEHDGSSRGGTAGHSGASAAGRVDAPAGADGVEMDRVGPVVVFAGRLPYAETLRRIAAADAVVQTSIGFETQGMTVFEAASLGTPAIVSDRDIAEELEAGHWTVAGDSVGALADALRAASADIAAGRSPLPHPTVRERFRQSSRTAAMIEVYRRAMG